MAHIVTIDEKKKKYKVMYECRCKGGGRKRMSKTFTNVPLREVKKFQRQMEMQYEKSQGIYYDKLTVAEAVDKFMEVYGPTLSPSTLRGYKTSFYADPYGIVANLGTMDIKKVRLEHVQDYINYLQAEGKSPKTIQNRARLIHTLFDRLRKQQYLERDHINPAEDIVLPKGSNKPKLKPYDFDEIKLLAKLVDEYGNPYLTLSVYLGLYAGLRRSEMACLTFDDIDFDKKIIHITKALVRGEHNKDYMKDTKSKAGIRNIPIVNELLEVLRKRRVQYNKDKLAHGDDFEDKGYLFSDEYGHRFTVQSITHRYQRFQDFAEKRGLRKLNFHFLRHGYATLLFAANVNLKTAQTLMGHSSLAMTADLYADCLSSSQQEAGQQLENLLKAHA